MNILIISQNIALGGAQRVAVHLSDYLNRHGHNAWIFAPHVDLEDMPHVARRQKYIECPYPILKKVGYEYKMKDNIFSLFLNILRMRRYLKRVVKRYDINLISAHNPPSNWIASFSKVPVVWSCNEPVSLCFSRRKPDYFPLSVQPPTSFSHMLERIYEMVDYALCHWGIDHLVVLSRYTQRGVRNIYHRESHICRVGVDFDLFSEGSGEDVRRRYHCEDSFLLLHVGHFKPEKNQHISVRALHLLKDKIPELRLLFVGAGMLEDQTKQLTEALGLKDRVIFAGRVSDEQLPDYYDACNLVVFPAVRQSWGLVVFEALAVGKLSLASSDCGASEVLIDEGIGFSCDPTPERVAGKVLEIYNKKDSRAEMIDRGRKYVQRELSYEAYGKRMLEMFENVLAGRSPEV
ncbi:MAG: glycosyltransferase family 4 protein [Candidatus Hydrogenedentota bacterium]|nr:MAG: glycosyltransferase family 4 protein [Candidatus Hydrogenedentota bacterium]